VGGGFPRGDFEFSGVKHDDQVDALGLVGQLLDQMVIGAANRPPSMKLREDGYRHDRHRKLDTVDPMTL